MASEKRRAFAVAFVTSVCVFGAAAMWLIPAADTPAPVEPVTRLWQAEDAVELSLVVRGEDFTSGAALRFDPARTAITVTDTDSAAGGVAELSVKNAVAMLAALGNDLPLALSAPVDITEDGAYLHLTADTHILTAEQVGMLLEHDPTLWVDVIVSAVNTYRTKNPQALFQTLVNLASYTNLSVQNYVSAHDAVTYLWEANTGHLCRAEASQQAHVQY